MLLAIQSDGTVVHCPFGQGYNMTLSMDQAAERISATRFGWQVWLNGSDEDLNAVDRVTYHLHPTFVEPERTVTDRSTNFILRSEGWGEFNVGATVFYKNGQTEELGLDLAFPSSAEEASEGTKVFISFAAVDGRIASAVSEALIQDGYNVSTVADVKLGEPLGDRISELIKTSDAVVVIRSDARSRWVQKEIDWAQSLGKPVRTVWVGRPEQSMQAGADLVLSSDDNPSDLVEELRGRLQFGSGLV
jgi:hypothetical protein